MRIFVNDFIIYNNQFDRLVVAALKLSTYKYNRTMLQIKKVELFRYMNVVIKCKITLVFTVYIKYVTLSVKSRLKSQNLIMR